jgi:hypothetical protein
MDPVDRRCYRPFGSWAVLNAVTLVVVSTALVIPPAAAVPPPRPYRHR